MPTFATPEPIELRVKSSAGDVRLEASARQDTEVDVRPSKPGRSEDEQLAEHTSVEHRDGTIVVEVPDKKGRWPWSSGSVEIRIGLPEGSTANVNTASADIYVTGRLADATMHTASGDVRLDEVANLRSSTASGDLAGRRVDGDLEAKSASGDIAVREVQGNAQASAASGDVTLGEVQGDTQLNTASGDGTVTMANGSVTGKTASGDLRIGSVRRGHVSVDTASGDVRLGVASGTAAWLDVSSLSGDVASSLDQADQPGESEETVEVRIRTLSGDITINRA